ncbi:Hypothetical protein, putative [Bodo saltans]|uniref:Uncharacterized protein n=1 Tax=Bodo saltans TaxID=75058 RepID=A0A0S4IM22_BODSA|nr:Hypothetical protein, putative [Bodo saltans]|eukprot:CUE71608.1 Hypothetical protein, putative [Bodo saltans]
MTAPPRFLKAEIEKAASHETSHHDDGSAHWTLTSSSWLDDVVLELIPMAEKHRCVLRISSPAEFLEMIRCFRVGWQRIASHATSTPPSQSTLDLFFVHWSTMLPLLVGFIARSFSREVLLYHIALAETLRDALLAISSRAGMQSVEPIEVPQEVKIIFSLLSDTVKTVVSYYFYQDQQPEDHDERVRQRCPDAVDESLLIPPFIYICSLRKITEILRPVPFLCAAGAQAKCSSPQNDFCLTLDNHCTRVIQHHVTSLLVTVVLPGLYGERWTASSAKYFGGRGVSHSVRFYFSTILTRSQTFLNCGEAAIERVDSIATARDILFNSHSNFLAEYVRFLCSVGAESAEENLQITPNRKQQLLVDALFVVRVSRWIILLYRSGAQRSSLAQLVMRVLAASSAHAHGSTFHDAMENVCGSVSSTVSTAEQQLQSFLENTWRVADAVRSWKEIADASTSSIVARMRKLELLEVDLPLPTCFIASIADDNKAVEQHRQRLEPLMRLLTPDEVTCLLRYSTK